MLTPILDALDEETDGRLTIVKANVDENMQTAGSYGVRAVPTLMLFNNGTVLQQRAGVLNKEQLTSWIDGVLSATAPAPVESVSQQ